MPRKNVIFVRKERKDGVSPEIEVRRPGHSPGPESARKILCAAQNARMRAGILLGDAAEAGGWRLEAGDWRLETWRLETGPGKSPGRLPHFGEKNLVFLCAGTETPRLCASIEKRRQNAGKSAKYGRLGDPAGGKIQISVFRSQNSFLDRLHILFSIFAGFWRLKTAKIRIFWLFYVL